MLDASASVNEPDGYNTNGRPSGVDWLPSVMRTIEQTITQVGSLEPIFFECIGTEVVMHSIPPDKYDFNKSGDKRRLAADLKVHVAHSKPDAHALCCEAWMAKFPLTGMNDEEREAKLEWINEHGVSALPDHEKQETIIVFLTINKPDKERWMVYIPVTRVQRTRTVVCDVEGTTWSKMTPPYDTSGTFSDL